MPRENETWIRLALEHGRIAVSRDPLDATAHAAYTNALILRGQHEAALRETTHAVAMNPNSAMAQGMHGGILAYSGHPADSFPYLEQALRLNPLDPLRFIWVHMSCTAYFLAGDFESCLSAGQDLCRMQPDLNHGYRAVLVALTELGRTEEAGHYADILYSKFAKEMRAFLAIRYPEFREVDYAAIVTSLAKGGLVLSDGELARIG